MKLDRNEQRTQEVALTGDKIGIDDVTQSRASTSPPTDEGRSPLPTFTFQTTETTTTDAKPVPTSFRRLPGDRCRGVSGALWRKLIFCLVS